MGRRELLLDRGVARGPRSGAEPGAAEIAVYESLSMVNSEVAMIVPSDDDPTIAVTVSSSTSPAYQHPDPAQHAPKTCPGSDSR